jgi:hypothetical protein
MRRLWGNKMERSEREAGRDGGGEEVASSGGAIGGHANSVLTVEI